MPLLPKCDGFWLEGIFIRMEQFEITKLPFTSISRENWLMLKDLDMETLYDVIQHVSAYVLTGEECDCDTTLSKVVCNQLISVINRKGQKSYNSSKNLPNGKKEKAKEEETPAQVSAYTPKEKQDKKETIQTENLNNKYDEYKHEIWERRQRAQQI